MSKVAVVYWSGTGNTEAMAGAVGEGAQAKGLEVEVMSVDSFTADMADNYTGIAFGCPSMGTEVLEESEFQPMWDDVKGKLEGKTIVLFGSYGWGDGEWMREWEADCTVTVAGTYICNETPDDEALEECKALGEKLA
ncbi:MAG: flavodoxin domain-containing protein [Eubacteriales bacterium]